MKKILLIIVLMASAAAVQQSYGQACAPGAISRWTGTSQPGDHFGITTAPITINGASADWEAAITGPFAYAGAPKGGYESDPYPTPISAPNVQVDGLKGAVGSNFDRDCVGQDHRDLRYFAFTYDVKNIYFLFRRPKNNTAQVSLYYFIDKNVDGFMAQGEPVIKVTFNNPAADIEMGYYHPVNSNGTAAGSYDPVKGNIMTAPVAQAQNCPGTSQWTIGAADGWSMPGDFVGLGNNVNLPPLASGEVFNAATFQDVHPDGSVGGYGVEFAIPWQYIGNYTASGLTAGTSLNFNNVFTYHVSLVSGNSGVSGAEDNAGGCCSGLAFSGNANSTPGASTVSLNGIPNRQYRLKLSYIESVGYASNVILGQIDFSNVVGFGILIPDPTTYTVTVYKGDAAGNPIPGTAQTFSYTSTLAGVYTFVGTPVIVSVATGGTARFVVDIDFGAALSTKSATVTAKTSNEFNVASTNCQQLGTTNNSNNVGILTALPVSFKSFTATRSHSNVVVKWETATEINNRGFAVERNINGTWEQVAFVPSQALNGNSDAVLSYQFVDMNNTKGITQYRIRQIDIDAKSKYSEVRAVRGEGQIGKTVVYPNPSNDGRVNIVFEDANVSRDISVTDMSGRTVKQMRNITNNNITIENLTPGMYSLRIVVPATGDQTVEKIVVNKR